MGTTNPQIWSLTPSPCLTNHLEKNCSWYRKNGYWPNFSTWEIAGYEGLIRRNGFMGKYIILDYKLGPGTSPPYRLWGPWATDVEPCFSNPTFIDLENSPVWKKKERGMEPSCYTTTSYKLSYPPHRLTEARLASLEKVHKLWRSKWGILSWVITPYMYVCIY